MADRTAHVTWSGSLLEGGGTITSVGSGAFGPLDVTWDARTEDSDGRTSPEELIAAAHAACFSMALSSALAKAGTPPEKLDVDATVTLRRRAKCGSEWPSSTHMGAVGARGNRGHVSAMGRKRSLGD